MNRNSRIFLAIFGRPFLLRLVWPLGLLLFAVSQADATVDWTAVRESLAMLEPWQLSLVITVLFLSWGVSAGRALSAVWRQPVIAFLVRQPMSRREWVRYLAPSLFVAFLPVTAICWLAPQYANPIVHYAGFAALAWPIILGGSYRGRSAAKWIALGAAALATLTFAYAYKPATAYLALMIAVLLIPLSVSAIREQVAGSRQIHSARLASISPVFAIVRRDLLYLRRMQRNGLLGLAFMAALAALMMFALRVNGNAAGGEAFDLACGLLALAVVPVFEILERTKKELGPAFMRLRWPIDHLDRGLALVCLIFVLMGPALITIAATGSTMGPGYLALFMLYGASALTCVGALFSLFLADQVASTGWGMLVLLVHAVLAIALSPLVYGATAAIAIPAGFLLTLRGLRKFTHRMETAIIEPSA
ncbi:MAG TPA: hypothetical protein VFG91_02220 [Woeseiaceae bacterium]|nr:hypothetical protein [Woeseiaceae bacterium]